MIEILEGFPGNVIAATVKGRLTRSDYEDVLIPKAEAVFSGRTRARCYYEVGSQFTGVDANCDVGRLQGRSQVSLALGAGRRG
jgi:hypothetical protein